MNKRKLNWNFTQSLNKIKQESDRSTILSEYDNDFLQITERNSNLGSGIRNEIEKKHSGSTSKDNDYTFPRHQQQPQEELVRSKKQSPSLSSKRFLQRYHSIKGSHNGATSNSFLAGNQDTLQKAKSTSNKSVLLKSIEPTRNSSFNLQLTSKQKSPYPSGKIQSKRQTTIRYTPTVTPTKNHMYKSNVFRSGNERKSMPKYHKPKQRQLQIASPDDSFSQPKPKKLRRARSNIKIDTSYQNVRKKLNLFSSTNNVLKFSKSGYII